MMMKKFLGATAREAMQKMKAALGPDALVISNRKTAGGVEILAMVEAPGEIAVAAAAPVRPPAAPARAAKAGTPAVPAPRRAQREEAPQRDGHFTSLKDYAPRVEAPQSPRPIAPKDWEALNAYASQNVAAKPTAWPAAAARGTVPAAVAGAAQVATAAPAGATPAPLTSPSPHEALLMRELSSMKSMLQDQIAGMAWRDMSERRPLAVKLWRELVEAGFSASLARTVADKLPDDHNEAQSRKWVSDVLSRNLRCVDPARDMVEAGGIYALVGPTGVGKTTTTAKLAARCVVKYGAQSLGLITTDSYRIGAFDQLSIYGKILGVPVHSAQSYGELEATIATMSGKRMVLIDTTGMGQRDNRVSEQINLLDNPSIRRVLLLNAAAQAETLEDVARAYQGKAAGARPLAGAILTKIDEAAKLGPVLDVVARHSLEILAITNGQRVPEDLHQAAGNALVHRALKAVVDPVFAWHDNEVAARALALARIGGSSADAGFGRLRG
jgi:flagellar biosynthesis protein FlhF